MADEQHINFGPWTNEGHVGEYDTDLPGHVLQFDIFRPGAPWETSIPLSMRNFSETMPATINPAIISNIEVESLHSEQDMEEVMLIILRYTPHPIPACPTHGFVITTAWTNAHRILATLSQGARIPYGNIPCTGASTTLLWRDKRPSGNTYSKNGYFRVLVLWICQHATEFGLAGSDTKRIFDQLFGNYVASLGATGGVAVSRLSTQLAEHSQTQRDVPADYKGFLGTVAVSGEKLADWAIVLAHVLRAMQQLGIQSNSRPICQGCQERAAKVVEKKRDGKYSGLD